MTTPDPIILDWSKHSVETLPMDRDALKRAKRCVLCDKPAWMRDEHGKPRHKVCAEAEAEQARSDGPTTAAKPPRRLRLVT